MTTDQRDLDPAPLSEGSGAVIIKTEISLDAAMLGTEVWEWDSEYQAAFLARMAATFRTNGGAGVMQMHHITDQLTETDRDNVAWFCSHFTEDNNA